MPLSQGLWLALALSAGSSGPSKIAVMDVTARIGVPVGVVQLLTDALVAEVRKRSPASAVISASDIRAMLRVEKQKQQLGCDDTAASVSCMAEIGGALGAERMLTASLGRLGQTYIYSLKLINVPEARVINEASDEFSTRSDDELLTGTRRLVAELFGETVPPSATGVVEVRAQPHSHALALALGAAGLVCAGVAVYGLVRVLSYDAEANTVNSGANGGSRPLDYGGVQSDRSAAQVFSPLSIGLAVLGAAGLSGMVLTW